MGRGRPVEGLILTEDERNYLKRQVRRHRVARSLSERCRIVVRCADGLQSKQVAAGGALRATRAVPRSCI